LNYNKNNQALTKKYEEPEKINEVLKNFYSQIQNQAKNGN